jgi:hypothetical protein
MFSYGKQDIIKHIKKSILRLISIIIKFVYLKNYLDYFFTLIYVKN